MLDINMTNSLFMRPKDLKNEPTPILYVANCGPAVGMSLVDIESTFGNFGKVIGVHAADETGTRVIVCFSEVSAAQEAFKLLNGCPCAELGGRTMHIRYSVPRRPQKVHGDVLLPVCLLASNLGIPGIYLVHDFITLEEEKELLAEVDSRQWRSLSKRRVQHYGFEFSYNTRNVDSKQCLGELPSFVSNILKKISSFPGLDRDEHKEMDQLTVDTIGEKVIRRSSRRVSFTFRKVRKGPCCCPYKQYCDSQMECKEQHLNPI